MVLNLVTTESDIPAASHTPMHVPNVACEHTCNPQHIVPKVEYPRNEPSCMHADARQPYRLSVRAAAALAQGEERAERTLQTSDNALADDDTVHAQVPSVEHLLSMPREHLVQLLLFEQVSVWGSGYFCSGYFCALLSLFPINREPTDKHLYIKFSCQSFERTNVRMLCALVLCSVRTKPQRLH